MWTNQTFSLWLSLCFTPLNLDVVALLVSLLRYVHGNYCHEVSQADGGCERVQGGVIPVEECQPSLYFLPYRQFVIRALPKCQEAYANLPHEIFSRAHPYSLH